MEGDLAGVVVAGRVHVEVCCSAENFATERVVVVGDARQVEVVAVLESNGARRQKGNLGSRPGVPMGSSFFFPPFRSRPLPPPTTPVPTHPARVTSKELGTVLAERSNGHNKAAS